VDLNDRAINERIFEVEVFAHGVEKALEYAGLGPPAKPPELAVPMAKGRRQIAPRGPGAHAPRDRFQKQEIVLCGGPGIAELTRKMRFKPLLVHSNHHFGSLNQKSDQMGILNAHGS